MNWKGFIKNKKKGSLSDVTADDIFVVDKPHVETEETDPTVPSHVKEITQNDINFWNTQYQHPPKTWIDKSNLTGNKVISNLTVNSLGHPINWVTRSLSPSDIGALPESKAITDISFSGTTTKTATITLADGSTITGTFSDLSGTGGDGYISSGSFNTSTGLVTLNLSSGGTVTFNLDDRYSLIGHTHSWSQITGKPTLDNYDGWNLKTNGIQRIKVASGGDADFVAGTNIFISYGAGGQVIFNVPVFDNYNSWSIGANGNYTAIGSGENVNFTGSGSITVDRSGNTINIHGTDSTGTGADGNSYVSSGSYNNSTREITLNRNDGGSITFSISPRKTVKNVSSPSYTLQSTDQYRWLVFTSNCTVTVPTGMVVDDLFEGEADINATVTFQAASGVTLRHVASVSKTLSPNGVFGIRFRVNNNCVLYGTDPVNYLNQ